MTDQDTVVQEFTTVSTPAAGQMVKQTRVIRPAVVAGSAQQSYDTKKVIFRAYQVVWYILGVVEVLLAFRMLLQLTGANAFSGFADIIFTLSGPFARPFSGILGTTSLSSSTIEWSTFIAMIVYGIIAYGIVALLQLVKPTNPEEVHRAVDNQ